MTPLMKFVVACMIATGLLYGIAFARAANAEVPEPRPHDAEFWEEQTRLREWDLQQARAEIAYLKRVIANRCRGPY
jgi:hypothetical protein